MIPHHHWVNVALLHLLLGNFKTILHMYHKISLINNIPRQTLKPTNYPYRGNKLNSNIGTKAMAVNQTNSTVPSCWLAMLERPARPLAALARLARVPPSLLPRWSGIPKVITVPRFSPTTVFRWSPAALMTVPRWFAGAMRVPRCSPAKLMTVPRWFAGAMTVPRWPPAALMTVPRWFAGAMKVPRCSPAKLMTVPRCWSAMMVPRCSPATAPLFPTSPTWLTSVDRVACWVSLPPWLLLLDLSMWLPRLLLLVLLNLAMLLSLALPYERFTGAWA